MMVNVIQKYCFAAANSRRIRGKIRREKQDDIVTVTPFPAPQVRPVKYLP